MGVRWFLNAISSPKINFSEHFLERASQRGYSQNDVIEIMKKGERSIGNSKYGELQYRYELNRNVVIQNVKDKKVVTVFSDMPKTSLHVKGYKIPWK